MGIFSKSFSLFFKKSFSREVLVYSFIIGLFSGLVASLFYYLLEFLKYFFTVYISGKNLINPVGEHIYFDLGSTFGISIIFFFLPAIGALISGVLVHFFAPTAKGNGTDAMIHAFHRQKGEVKPKVPLIKAIASLFVISTNLQV